MEPNIIANPFMPGAGHMPPYLAGREHESEELRCLLRQDKLKNMILTGLRGLGKTVLLETFKPIGIQAGWLWAANDLSESSSISEEHSSRGFSPTWRWPQDPFRTRPCPSKQSDTTLVE